MEITFEKNCLNEKSEILKQKKPDNTGILEHIYKNKNTTVDNNFCDPNVTDLAVYIKDENIIGYGSNAIVYDLKNIFGDNKEYVLRLTSNEHLSDEYYGLVVQGILAKICQYVNPVKQIGVFQKKGGMIHYNNIKLSTGIYAILEKGVYDLRNVRENEKKDENFTNIIKQNYDKIIIQILEAMKCIHKNGFIHRDLKPDNIIMNSNGDIQLIDFGYARKTNTNLSDNAGTKGYKSNRIYGNGKAINFQDYNSIGVTIQNILDYIEFNKRQFAIFKNSDEKKYSAFEGVAKSFEDKNTSHTDPNLIETSIEKLTKLENKSTGGRNRRILKKSRRKSRKIKRKSKKRR
jgi:serine/threonine protein kinase